MAPLSIGSGPIGLLGLGEAGYELARGWRTLPHPPLVCAYDRDAPRRASAPMLPASPGTPIPPASRGALILQRARETGVGLAQSVAALLSRPGLELVFSAVTAAGAWAVLEAAGDGLAGKVYVDLNTMSPPKKRALGEAVAARGGYFVDAAVVGRFAVDGHRVPMLLSGPGAAALAEAAPDLGLNVKVVGLVPGEASAIKMFRSIFQKGLDSLVWELATAASAYGVLEQVMATLDEPGRPFAEFVDYRLTGAALHAARRAEEMADVVEFLTEIGADATMARAEREKLAAVAALGLDRHFAGRTVAGHREVLAALSSMAREDDGVDGGNDGRLEPREGEKPIADRPR